MIHAFVCLISTDTFVSKNKKEEKSLDLWLVAFDNEKSQN